SPTAARSPSQMGNDSSSSAGRSAATSWLTSVTSETQALNRVGSAKIAKTAGSARETVIVRSWFTRLLTGSRAPHPPDGGPGSPHYRMGRPAARPRIGCFIDAAKVLLGGGGSEREPAH